MSPSMRVIVFASQKGGSGKTALASHIAVEALRRGAGPVMLIDTDPQGALSRWGDLREAPEPAVVQSVYSNLPNDLDQARAAGVRLVVIDTSPASARALSEAARVASLVVSPVRPSTNDWSVVKPIVEIAEMRRKPVVFVINGATARSRVASGAAIALSQHGTVAPSIIHSRADFAQSLMEGGTVVETDPEGRSAREIRRLWDYLADRLQKANVVPAAEDSGGERPARSPFSGRS